MYACNLTGVRTGGEDKGWGGGQPPHHKDIERKGMWTLFTVSMEFAPGNLTKNKNKKQQQQKLSIFPRHQI